MTGLQVGYGAILLFLLTSLLLGIVSVFGVGYWSVRLADRLGSDHPLFAGVVGAIACFGLYGVVLHVDSALALWGAIALGAAVVAFSVVAAGVGLVRRGYEHVRK